ncbi:hypothetical protein [Catenuloplanes indicus]|uniref:Uncharacterized protein n=1 Tax=Catenuloplanes indicus TaxID=137267 RepID=A0AAE4AUY0_9ACTN|nr:hypothetical protein [Catenuloplanes indicus]MDQ0363407.1 hypothetical protein [Catenuloplanes indicus]
MTPGERSLDDIEANLNKAAEALTAEPEGRFPEWAYQLAHVQISIAREQLKERRALATVRAELEVELNAAKLVVRRLGERLTEIEGWRRRL